MASAKQNNFFQACVFILANLGRMRKNALSGYVCLSGSQYERLYLRAGNFDGNIR
jgi:hypothetical protein